MFNTIRQFFAAAPHIEQRPPAEVRRLYPRFRWRIMEATFIGYAMFYLVRNNLAVVSKDMREALTYTDGQIGNILAITAITYGLGKFMMGALSDRSNPRVFMACGLLLTALCNFAFGSVMTYPMHLFLWGLNGLVQGMGWPPCGRSMGHWFHEKERGLTFSIWNTSHNVGGGVAGYLAGMAAYHYGGWQYAFYIPGVIAAIGSIYLFWRLRDTPQSVGLPPIEEYKTDLGQMAVGTPVEASPERELTFRELLFVYVLTNKLIWLLALANFFAYIARYSMLDWAPMYLRDVKGASLTGGGAAILVNEFGGIASTILLGWVSDRLGGRRGLVATLCMLPIMMAFAVILLTPPGYLWLDFIMLAVIGCFIYPVINLIVIMALDLTSKKAIGTAAGFIGLFGYLGRTAQAKGFGSMLESFKVQYGVEVAWDIVLWSTLGCSAVAMVLLAFTWGLRPRRGLAA